MTPRVSAAIIAMTEMLIPAPAPAERPALWEEGWIIGVWEKIVVKLGTVVFVVVEESAIEVVEVFEVDEVAEVVEEVVGVVGAALVVRVYPFAAQVCA
jgi:hypothetical protein